MISFVLIRRTSAITDAQLARTCEALMIALNDTAFRAAWSPNDAITVRVDTSANPSDWPIYFDAEMKDAGALGEHDDPACPTGYVSPELDAADRASVTQTTCHEAMEMLGDPAINGVRNGWALEICDPCEDDDVSVTLADGTREPVSAYVLPAWFDGGVGPFDSNRSIIMAGGLTPGGYAQHQGLGGWTMVTGARGMRAYRAARHAHSRGARRSAP